MRGCRREGRAGRLKLTDAAVLGRRRRALAATVGIDVITAAILTGVDARWIGARAASSHEAGECATADDAGERFWTVHKFVDGALAGRLGASRAGGERRRPGRRPVTRVRVAARPRGTA